MLAARLAMFALVSCLAATGCRGCDDAPAAEAEPQRSGESALQRVRARMAGRHIDFGKTYATLADGAADCADDVDCFVAHADRCAPAVLDHAQRDVGVGMTLNVRSRFRIQGPEGEACRVLRTVFSADVIMLDAMREALIKSGKTADEVDVSIDELESDLRHGNPPRLRCSMPVDRALELALDLAEKKFLAVRLDSFCQPASPDEAWPDQERAAQVQPVSPAEPAAVPAKNTP